jgi:hypothetical protein
MLPLIVALALTSTPDVAAPAPDGQVARHLTEPRCIDIDPYLVRYVPPPRHSAANPLLWWIGGEATTRFPTPSLTTHCASPRWVSQPAPAPRLAP